ncbi:hypothetical protein BSZ39_11835 [Bowdeniella nasicola]|uniref:Uncharacterized protein n=2 Tax=Bowdeniella nasicola TaxID=208480 RepID=A0A1Q5PZE9_9ACTO|nr:hypothetical protein BSZ39_11835 [Bowdeniella nasicola]
MVIVSGLLYIVVWSTGFVDSGWSRTWRLFNVAEERNAATWLASSLWLVFALTAVVVGLPRGRCCLCVAR